MYRFRTENIKDERSMARLLFSQLRSVGIIFKMSKFGSGYRRKSGNCNKPFRRFQDYYDDEPGCSGIQAKGSRNLNLKNSEYSDGRKTGFRSGQQERDSGSASERGFNSNKGTFKVGLSFNRKYNTKSSVRLEADSGHATINKERPRHPPGLKGKEIGLWYRNQKKNDPESLKKRDEKTVEVLINSKMQNFLEGVLCRVSRYVRKDENDMLHNEEGIESKEGPMTMEDKINSIEVKPKKQDPVWDRKLYNEFQKKQKMHNYVEMAAVRETLPAYALKQEIVNLIEENQVVVISGGTGCGKTTQIVQYVLDHYITNYKGSLCNIICTQPRRISAITVAERVAAERDEPLGQSIGYNIRLEHNISSQTKGCINFMTTGILLTMLKSEPILNDVSHLFLDEIHERNIESDLLMALLKYIMPKRPDLKIVLMSATVNEDSFCTYFSNSPKISIPGFTHPVKEIFLEDILGMTSFSFDKTKHQNPNPIFNEYILPYLRDIKEKKLYSDSVINELKNPNSEVLNLALLTAIVEYICKTEDNGAILVFLPGIGDIIAMKKMIKSSLWYSPQYHIVTLMHSILPSSEQKQAFVVPPRGTWKIVLASPILETSVTINDISYVVDCGKAKLSGYDIKRNIATLEPTWISLANAKQRQGRAGRTKPGKCYKAYTKIRQELFEKYPTPESLTTSMEEVILKAKMLQLGQVAPFLSKLMDPPDPKMVELSLRMLRNLNILDSEERLTPLGYHVAKLPMHPRMGKMILMGALFNCIDPVAAIAACLSYKDPFFIPLGKEDDVHKIKEVFADGEKSDHFIYSEALRLWEEYDAEGCGDEFANSHFLCIQNIRLISELKKQFGKTLYEMNFLEGPDVKNPVNNVNSNNRALVKAIVCAGLYPNVAFYRKKFRKSEHLLKTPDHKAVHFHIKSHLNKTPWFESPFFVYHLILKSNSINIHDATMIPTMPLLFFGERLEIEIKNGECYLRVDDHIVFKSNKPTGVLIKCLRKRLDEILEKAISNPEEFKWLNEDPKTEILSAIVSLLSSESMTVFEDKDDTLSHTVFKYISHA